MKLRLDLSPRDWLWIALAGVGLIVYTLAAQNTGRPGFPLDDSWIHQTYARNLGTLGQWAYTPGMPSAGSTSPLYTVLLAFGYTLRLPYMLWTQIVGAAALALGAMCGARLAERLFPNLKRVGLWAGLALVTAWHLVWAAASGMETMCFAALCLAVCERAARNMPQTQAQAQDSASAITPRVALWRGGAFGLVAAILIAARPEGLILAGMAVLAVIAARPPRLLYWLIGGLIGGALGLTPYLLLNLATAGTIFPTTFAAKQIKNAVLLNQGLLFNLREMITPLTAGGQLALLPGALLAGMTWLGKSRDLRRLPLQILPLAWSVALILLYTLRMPAPYQHGRYVIPALPTFIVVGVGGTLLLAKWGARRKVSLPLRALARSAAILTPPLFAIYWFIGADVFATDVQMINSDMVVAAEWVAINVPRAELLAVHDIGAVGFFANRPILDIAGLVSPEVIPLFFDPASMSALMRSRDVRWVMVLPSQWLDLWTGQPEIWGLDYCLRFDAGGQMGGMRLYEYQAGGCG